MSLCLRLTFAHLIFFNVAAADALGIPVDSSPRPTKEKSFVKSVQIDGDMLPPEEIDKPKRFSAGAHSGRVNCFVEGKETYADITFSIADSDNTFVFFTADQVCGFAVIKSINTVK